jgi:formylglycine-generating enzyme required for sulfatase activity
VSNLAPVGTASNGAGAWGQLDLAGQLWEWNLDAYSSTYVDPCINCANLANASDSVIRGGFFQSSPSPDLTPPNRSNDGTAGPRRDYIGFRCARHP